MSPTDEQVEADDALVLRWLQEVLDGKTTRGRFGHLIVEKGFDDVRLSTAAARALTAALARPAEGEGDLKVFNGALEKALATDNDRLRTALTEIVRASPGLVIGDDRGMLLAMRLGQMAEQALDRSAALARPAEGEGVDRAAIHNLVFEEVMSSLQKGAPGLSTESRSAIALNLAVKLSHKLPTSRPAQAEDGWKPSNALLRPLRAVAKGASADINLLAGRAADEIERLMARIDDLEANLARYAKPKLATADIK